MTFTVGSGPHAGTTGTAITGSDGTVTFSYTGTAAGLDTLSASFIDHRGVTQTSNPVMAEWTRSGNAPPTASAGGPYAGNEGSSINIVGTAIDPDGAALGVTWAQSAGPDVDAGAACTFSDTHSLATSVVCTDDGTFRLTLTADDGVNPPVSSTATLTLRNAPPSLRNFVVSGGNTVACPAGNTVGVSFGASDPGSNDMLTGTIYWGTARRRRPGSPPVTPMRPVPISSLRRQRTTTEGAAPSRLRRSTCSTRRPASCRQSTPTARATSSADG